MLYIESLAQFVRRCLSPKKLLLALALLLLPLVVCLQAQAQSYPREFETPEKAAVSIKNLDGKVSVVAAEDQQGKVTVAATSAGRSVDPDDVTAQQKGGRVEINVRPRREQDRIDLVVRVPIRSKVEIDSRAGAVDVVGNVESAFVRTDTGTIHAD